HRLAHEREVEPTALVRDGSDDVHLVIHDLPWGIRIEEDQELRRTGAEPLHLLDAPPVQERGEPPIPLLLVSGLLERHEEPGPAREDEPIDRRRHSELRIQEVAARVRGQRLRDAELDRLHLVVRRGLRILRMDHLLEAPPLVHRDHREAARVVRNLLKAAEFADRNPHPCHPDDLHKSRAILTFAAYHVRENQQEPRRRRTGIEETLGFPPSACARGSQRGRFHPSHGKGYTIDITYNQIWHAPMPRSAAGVPPWGSSCPVGSR